MPRAALSSSPAPSRNASLTHTAPGAHSRLARLIVAERRWVVLAMLLARTWRSSPEPGIFQRVWLLVHFGSPFRCGSRSSPPSASSTCSRWCCSSPSPSPPSLISLGWMMITWLLVLIGILGGRVFTVQAARRNRFVTLRRALPALCPHDHVLLGRSRADPRRAGDSRFGGAIRSGTSLFTLAALVVAAATRGRRHPLRCSISSYAVLVFQLGVVLVLGSIVAMRFTDEDYVTSVAVTVMAFGLALFVFAVLWNPMRGFGGLSTYFSSYLLSVGMPFELWMRRIAELAETETDPRRFLEAALREIALLPWMRGGHWRFARRRGPFQRRGRPRDACLPGPRGGLPYRDPTLPGAAAAHAAARAGGGRVLRGQAARERAAPQCLLQAVHETGARLTHDVKNLLQSLYALTSMAPRGPADGYEGLLQRQLPQLTKRLHATLEKLRSPEIAASERPVGGRGVVAGNRSPPADPTSCPKRIAAEGNHPGRALRQLRRERARQCARQGRARTGDRHRDEVRLRCRAHRARRVRRRKRGAQGDRGAPAGRSARRRNGDRSVPRGPPRLAGRLSHRVERQSRRRGLLRTGKMGSEGNGRRHFLGDRKVAEKMSPDPIFRPNPTPIFRFQRLGQALAPVGQAQASSAPRAAHSRAPNTRAFSPQSGIRSMGSAPRGRP